MEKGQRKRHTSERHVSRLHFEVEARADALIVARVIQCVEMSARSKGEKPYVQYVSTVL